MFLPIRIALKSWIALWLQSKSYRKMSITGRWFRLSWMIIGMRRMRRSESQKSTSVSIGFVSIFSSLSLSIWSYLVGINHPKIGTTWRINMKFTIYKIKTFWFWGICLTRFQESTRISLWLQISFKLLCSTL